MLLKTTESYSDTGNHFAQKRFLPRQDANCRLDPLVLESGGYAEAMQRGAAQLSTPGFLDGVGAPAGRQPSTAHFLKNQNETAPPPTT